MKVTALLAITLGALGVFAADGPAANSKVFQQVPLPAPDNWVAGRRLFPGNVIAGYNAELKDYDATSWAKHLLDECQTLKACTSVESFQANNSGSTGGRYWYGYVYRGGPTTAADYERDTDPASDVTDSKAFTIAVVSRRFYA